MRQKPKALILHAWRGTPTACAALPLNLLNIHMKRRAMRATLLLT